MAITYDVHYNEGLKGYQLKYVSFNKCDVLSHGCVTLVHSDDELDNSDDDSLKRRITDLDEAVYASKRLIVEKFKASQLFSPIERADVIESYRSRNNVLLDVRAQSK